MVVPTDCRTTFAGTKPLLLDAVERDGTPMSVVDVQETVVSVAEELSRVFALDVPANGKIPAKEEFRIAQLRVAKFEPAFSLKLLLDLVPENGSPGKGLPQILQQKHVEQVVRPAQLAEVRFRKPRDDPAKRGVGQASIVDFLLPLFPGLGVVQNLGPRPVESLPWDFELGDESGAGLFPKELRSDFSELGAAMNMFAADGGSSPATRGGPPRGSLNASSSPRPLSTLQTSLNALDFEHNRQNASDAEKVLFLSEQWVVLRRPSEQRGEQNKKFVQLLEDLVGILREDGSSIANAARRVGTQPVRDKDGGLLSIDGYSQRVAFAKGELELWRVVDVVSSEVSPCADKQGGSCPLLGAAGTNKPSSSSSKNNIKPGSRVALRNLESKPELNGITGTVLRLDDTTGRWMVQCDDGEKRRVWEKNLLVLQDILGALGNKPSPSSKIRLEKADHKTHLRFLDPEKIINVFDNFVEQICDSVGTAIIRHPNGRLKLERNYGGMIGKPDEHARGIAKAEKIVRYGRELLEVWRDTVFPHIILSSEQKITIDLSSRVQSVEFLPRETLISGPLRFMPELAWMQDPTLKNPALETGSAVYVKTVVPLFVKKCQNPTSGQEEDVVAGLFQEVASAAMMDAVGTGRWIESSGSFSAYDATMKKLLIGRTWDMMGGANEMKVFKPEDLRFTGGAAFDNML